MPPQHPLSVDGRTYEPTIFAIQAQAAYAKALIFASEGRVAIQERSYIMAAIASYYSLFHLSTSLVYLSPHLVDPKILSRLVKKRSDGLDDPTALISHTYLPAFLVKCEAQGLPGRLRQSLEHARLVREEYANYGPRIVWKDERPRFLTHHLRPSTVTRISASIPPLLRSSLRWAHKQHDSSWVVVAAITVSLRWFLEQRDLHYATWCSKKVRADAEALRKTLPYLPAERA